MRKVAVYGSLRVGEYNFNRFNNGDNIKIIAQEILVPGFDLYTLGPYPGIREGNNNLVVDILEFDDYTFKAIDSMEYGAGYYAKTINVEGVEGEVTIYVFKYPLPKEDLVVEGNWSNYLKSKK